MDSRVLPANDDGGENIMLNLFQHPFRRRATAQTVRSTEWMRGRARHDTLSYGVTVSEAHWGFGKADRPPRTFARSQGRGGARPAIEGSTKKLPLAGFNKNSLSRR
jgi:hypothetical protein